MISRRLKLLLGQLPEKPGLGAVLWAGAGSEFEVYLSGVP